MNNPFPGPQPYRASDRKRFQGRDDLSYLLRGAILVNRCVMVHGPSGAGKSSLVQASVIPQLELSHDIRVVRVDRWPEGESPTAWLADAIYSDLELGDVPGDASPADAVISAAQRAARGSSRLMVIYVDQLEQLLYPGRDSEAAEVFFDCLSDLVELPLRTLRVVMSLREDYLGRLRDRLRDRRRLLEAGFRVGPMTVGELTTAMCLSAASGEPAQQWLSAEVRELMLQVRVPGQEPSDDAEAQAAYAQIVCRALFQQRATGGIANDEVTEAEPILRRYLETTLSKLGPLHGTAQRLLEDHLVTAEGSRTLRTENELLRIVGADDLQVILQALESAAILHAEQHRGSRYFEIGHDWLARWVFEQRQLREREDAQRKREAEQRAALEKAKRSRRIYLGLTVGALAFAAGAGALGLWAYGKKIDAEKARKEALDNERIAKIRRSEAHDASILAGFRELVLKGKQSQAIKLLPEVDFPAERRGWVALASDALQQNALRFSFEGHSGPITIAEWSTDGTRILTASADGTARIWSADGKTAPIVLKGPAFPVTYAAWSHDGKQILVAFANGETHVFEAQGTNSRIITKGNGTPSMLVAWNRDDSRILTMATDGLVQVHAADGHGLLAEFDTPDTTQTWAVFHADGVRVFTGAEDGVVRVWDGKPKGRATDVGKHEAAVRFLALSPDGKAIVSTSADRTARIWNTEGKGAAVGPEMRHHGAVNHAAWSADGQFVATASTDRLARIWPVRGNGSPVVLEGHTHSVNQVAFRSDGRFVATVAQDGLARVFSVGGGAPFVLHGHDAPVGPVAWSPDGAALVTAAADKRGNSEDCSVKVWSAEPFRWIARGSQQMGVVHAAFVTGNGVAFVRVSDDGKARFSKVGEEANFFPFSGHSDWMTNAAISPQMDRVVTTSLDDTARVYRVDGRAQPVVLAGHEGDVRFAIFSPDGTRVLTGGDDTKARVFGADGQGTPLVFAGHEDALTAGAWSPDGKQFVTVSFDQVARVWNADGSGSSKVLAGHAGTILCVGFFPKDGRILTGSADHTARIWNSDGTHSILPHEAAVTAVAIRDDGDFIATASADRQVRIWRSDMKSAPIEFESSQPVLALAFRGKTEIVAIEQDGTEHVWVMDVQTLVSKLWQANSECLSLDMRTLYLGETKDTASKYYDACKKAPGITPDRPRELIDVEVDKAPWNPGAAHIPQDQTWRRLSKGQVRGKIVVMPADADVEGAGTAAMRHQGLIEIVGNVGDVFHVRVQQGDMFGEYPVKLEANGASPARIELVKPKVVVREKRKNRGVLLPDDM